MIHESGQLWESAENKGILGNQSVSPLDLLTHPKLTEFALL